MLYKHITLFRAIIVLCGTDCILWNIPHIHTSGPLKVKFVAKCSWKNNCRTGLGLSTSALCICSTFKSRGGWCIISGVEILWLWDELEGGICFGLGWITRGSGFGTLSVSFCKTHQLNFSFKNVCILEEIASVLGQSPVCALYCDI
jgi:hypothetical protein